MKITALIVVVALTWALPAWAAPLKGVALVIGESGYAELPALDNPKRDARAMDDLFDELGFSVDRVLDADGDKLRGRDRGLYRRSRGCRCGAGLLFRPRHRGGRRELPRPDRCGPVDAAAGRRDHGAAQRSARPTGQDRAGDHRPARCLPHQCLCRRDGDCAPGIGRGAAGGGDRARRGEGADAGGAHRCLRRQSRHGDRLCRQPRPAGARRRTGRELALCRSADQAFRGRRLFARRSDDAGDRGGLSQDQGAATALDQLVAAGGC